MFKWEYAAENISISLWFSVCIYVCPFILFCIDWLLGAWCDISNQWRIQDFPEEGAPTPGGEYGVWIWTPRGASLAPPLDPPLVILQPTLIRPHPLPTVATVHPYRRLVYQHRIHRRTLCSHICPSCFTIYFNRKGTMIHGHVHPSESTTDFSLTDGRLKKVKEQNLS